LLRTVFFNFYLHLLKCKNKCQQSTGGKTKLNRPNAGVEGLWSLVTYETAVYILFCINEGKEQAVRAAGFYTELHIYNFFDRK